MPENTLPRLVQAAKEFNIGKETLIDFLSQKKFDVKGLSVNSRLTLEMYAALEKEFKEDKITKEQSVHANTNTKELSEMMEAKKTKTVLKKKPKKGEEKGEEETDFIETKVPVIEQLKIFDSIDLDKLSKPKTETKAIEKVEKVEPPKVKTEEKKVVPPPPLEVHPPIEKEVKKVEDESYKTPDIKFGPINVIKKINIGEIEDKEQQVRESRRKRIIPVKPTTHEQSTSNTFVPRQDRDSKKYTPPLDKQDIKDRIKLTNTRMSSSAGSHLYNKSNKKQKIKNRKQRNEDIQRQKDRRLSEERSTLQVTEFISVSELASLIEVPFTDIIAKCMNLGIMVSVNQRLDAEIIELVASEYGLEVDFISQMLIEDHEEQEDDTPESLIPRPPIVTIMGHVDHGKTSLLDFVRTSNIIAGEAGGITQHIGAYEVTLENNKQITFLDTPGHEAFTAMRARGTKVTDIVVIVIAADDTVMPQTQEAISHAQAANVPMIFAINKIDKEGANPEKIKEQLAGMNLLVEDWGGKYQCEHISAKKGTNVDKLLEKILLEAELLDLKANPNKHAKGTILEASLEKGKGYVANVLVQEGTLHVGDMVVAGSFFGRVKAMFNERDKKVEQASLSAPVVILGLNGSPQPGESFTVYKNESLAKEVANKRTQVLREQTMKTKKHITLDEIGRRLSLGNFKQLNLIIKADFDGSVEALSDSLQKLSNDEIRVQIVHKAVGPISESDVLLAAASESIIIGFQVRPSNQAKQLAENEQIEIKTYSIIYQVIDEIKAAMEGMLSPDIKEIITGNLEVREIFKINNVIIAGCIVTHGKAQRASKIKLIRDGIVIYSGTENNPAEIQSLKRFKEDVKDVSSGMECGVTLKGYQDLKVGDIIEIYEIETTKRTL